MSKNRWKTLLEKPETKVRLMQVCLLIAKIMMILGIVIAGYIFWQEGRIPL